MSTVTIILFIALLVCLFLNIPVGFSLGISALVGLFALQAAGGGQSIGFLSQSMVIGCDSFPILAVPLFILAGELMGGGGISIRVLAVCNAIFGRFYGGLAICAVAFCMFFAAVSGSGPATVAAVGALIVPTMLKEGYSKEFTLATIACAGGIGVIIPPSIPMVFYGTTTGTSIGSLFMAGMGPGILIGVCLIIFCNVYGRKNGWRTNTGKFSVKVLLKAIWDGKFALLDPIIILGGIYSGIFTPTEAAAVACIYALFCGVFIHRELDLKSFFRVLKGAVSTTGTTMLIVGAATAFAKILSITGAPSMIASAIGSVSSSGVVVMLLINVLLLFVGCFMDTTPAMLILAPILMPIATAFGYDPIHFGIIMVVNLAIGFITPPLGINLFVAARVGDEPLETVVKGIIPFILIMLFDLLLITFVPAISMTLVNLLQG
ncbi:MAG: TRAP transporter large permease [Lachnospiraceae bacterium]|nr:TRAP transporter large permease [Lachnospiraceae bacterium]